MAKERYICSWGIVTLWFIKVQIKNRYTSRNIKRAAKVHYVLCTCSISGYLNLLRISIIVLLWTLLCLFNLTSISLMHFNEYCFMQQINNKEVDSAQRYVWKCLRDCYNYLFACLRIRRWLTGNYWRPKVCSPSRTLHWALYKSVFNLCGFQDFIKGMIWYCKDAIFSNQISKNLT